MTKVKRSGGGGAREGDCAGQLWYLEEGGIHFGGDDQLTEGYRDATAQFKAPRGATDEDLDLLLGLPLFEGLGHAQLCRLIADSWAQTSPTGTLLFLEGDPARHFYVVLTGWVKLFRTTPEGNEAIIAVVPGGQSFAEAAVFEDGTYPVSASVVEDSRLLLIPARPFVDKVIEDGRLVMKMMASMSRRLRQLVHQVEELSLRSSVERVAGYVLSLCATDSGPAIVRLPLDKALIAKHLGMQPETLSRSLARLRAQGIAAEGETISIPDVADLRRLCGESSASPQRLSR